MKGWWSAMPAPSFTGRGERHEPTVSALDEHPLYVADQPSVWPCQRDGPHERGAVATMHDLAAVDLHATHLFEVDIVEPGEALLAVVLGLVGLVDIRERLLDVPLVQLCIDRSKSSLRRGVVTRRIRSNDHQLLVSITPRARTRGEQRASQHNCNDRRQNSRNALNGCYLDVAATQRPAS